MKILVPIAVSRHAHLSRATLDRLFGAGCQLRPRTWLSQRSQFAAHEAIKIMGSHTDVVPLGIDAPLRISADLAQPTGAILENSAGRTSLSSGIISSRRHLHANPAEAERPGLCDGQSVQIEIGSGGRSLVFGDCAVRIAAGFT